MGLWNFVKNAGKSLVGSAEAAPGPEDLAKEIEGLGLDASGLDITVDGDTVKVSGAAVSQEMKEKVILAVGNIEGVAAVDDAVETSGTNSATHTVERGDTLSAIAKKTLGSANKYHAIFEANKPMLSHPDKIYPGQVLRIPQDA